MRFETAPLGDRAILLYIEELQICAATWTVAGPGAPMDSSKRYVAYYRVSTQMQFMSGYSIEAQRDAVLSYVKANRGLICGEFTEAQSGVDAWRPEVAKALALTLAVRRPHLLNCLAAFRMIGEL
jgi:hypothetical protein